MGIAVKSNMQKHIKIILAALLLICLLPASYAQNSGKVYKIAVFAPVYLDSVFTQDGAYRWVIRSYQNT